MELIDWEREIAAQGQRPRETDRPAILVATDRTWMHRWGVSRWTLGRIVRRAGGHPWRIDYGRGPEPQDIRKIAEWMIDGADGLLLSGGADVDPKIYGSAVRAKNVNPRRDRFELALLRYATERGIPVLGICRGSQLLNVGFGGTLRTIREDKELHQFHNRLSTHSVDLVSDTHVADVIGSAHLEGIRSLHGQAVDEPGESLRVIGHAEDGIIEGTESRNMADTWVIGVQWHPEFMFFENTEHRIIDDFVREAKKRKAVHS